jgi:methylated-DNA-[protein]-cysteine S-methyltransferase
MSIGARSYRTPFGTLSVVADDNVVISSGFQPLDLTVARLGLTSVKRGVLAEVTEAIEAYLAGDLNALTKVHTRQPGGLFVQKAWKAMSAIKAGRTLSYSELASKAGSTMAVRAAGSACARNWVAPFVPCHRIVKTGGALGNYGYGVPTKVALLEFEEAI